MSFKYHEITKNKSLWVYDFETHFMIRFIDTGKTIDRKLIICNNFPEYAQIRHLMPKKVYDYFIEYYFS